MRQHNSDLVTVRQPSVETYTRRTVTVDFLYLDDESCDRCVGTEEALETALDRVEPILRSLDTGLTVRDIHAETLEDAEATRLAVSPTIRIDGRDIQPDFRQNTCVACGDLCTCEGDVDCRIWHYRGDEYTAAPVDLIVEALLRAIVPDRTLLDDTDRAYQLSTNVRGFFGETDEGDGSDSACGCDC